MAASTPELHAFFFIWISSVSAQDVLRRHPGEDVIMDCQAGNVFIAAVEWTKVNLEPDSVLFYNDGHFDPTHQHTSYKNRVQLMDSGLKNGNLSLILKNISVFDNGTYECRVVATASGRKKRADIDTPPIATIDLVVTDSGSKTGNTTDGIQISHLGLVGVAVVGLVVAVVIIVVVVMNVKKHTNNKSEPSVAFKAVDDELI